MLSLLPLIERLRHLALEDVPEHETPDAHKARTGRCSDGFHADPKTGKCAPAGTAPPAPRTQSPKSAPADQRIPGHGSAKEYAASEWEEYGDNDFARNMFPDAFGSEKEFVQAVASSPTVGKSDWSKLHPWGGSVNNVKPGDLKGVRDEVWGYNKDRWLSKTKGDEKQARRMYDGYFDKLADAARRGDTPPSLVGVHQDQKTGKKTEYILGGNTRAMIYKGLNKPAPVRKIALKGRMNEPDDEGNF